MASTNEKPRPVTQSIEADRAEEAFEKLQIAWRAVRARLSPNGASQLDEETLKELDIAEQEWLAVRAEVSMGKT